LATNAPATGRVPKGVPPLRAGQGQSFFWRRLHSLTGIVPVGLFLIEHFLSNAEVFNGAAAYNAQVKFLTGLPFRIGLEVVGIFIPLAFHACYGLWIWWHGEGNVGDYSMVGNWCYTLQRWTGILVFAYVTYHLATLRFAGGSIMGEMGANPNMAFRAVQEQLQQSWTIAAYVVGIAAASWHFGYGLFLFAVKWGIVSGPVARKRLQIASIGVAVLLCALGVASELAFLPGFNRQTRIQNMQNNRPVAVQAQSGPAR